MKMAKELLVRGIQGAAIGVCLIFTIGIIAMISSQQVQYIESTYLIKQYVAGALIGFVFGSLNLLFVKETFNLLGSTIIHFLVICIVFYPMAYYANWIGTDALTIMGATMALITIYFFIWLTCYISWKKDINDINRSLSQTRITK